MCIRDRTYDHEGNLIGKRDPKDFVDFDDSCRSLHKVKVELLGNLIFVNFDLDADSLKENLGVIYDEIQEFQFENLSLIDHYTYKLKCNWKIALEANMEVYHVQSIHPETVHTGLDYTGNVNTFYPNGHGRMVAPSRTFPDLPEVSLKQILMPLNKLMEKKANHQNIIKTKPIKLKIIDQKLKHVVILQGHVLNLII